MNSAQFQSSAKSTAFNPLQAPDQTGAMRQQLNDQLRWMREDQQMVINDRQQFAAAMDRRMRDNQNVKQRDLEVLAGMSKTLTDTLLQIKKDKDQNDQEEGLLLYYQNGLPPDQVQQFEEGEQQLIQARDSTNAYADRLARNGAPPDVVEQVRNLNGWKRYGFMTGLAQDAGRKWSEFLDNALTTDDATQVTLPDGRVITPAGAQDKAELAAVTTVLRKQYLRANGLTGANPALLNKYLFPNMREGEEPVIGRRYRGIITAKAQETIDENDGILTTGLLSQGTAGAAFNAYVSNLRSIIDPKTGQLLGPGGARDRAIDVIIKLARDGQLDDSVITEIENTLIPGGTTETWGTKFRDKFVGLRDVIREGREADLAAQDREEERADKEREGEILALYAQKGGFTEAEKEAIRNAYYAARKPMPSNIEKLVTLEEKEDKQAIDYLNQLIIERGGITREDLMTGGYSSEVIRKFLPEVQRFETNINSNAGFKAAVKAVNQDLLNFTLRGTSVGARPNWTLALAQAQAERDLRIETLKNIQAGMQPDEAARAAIPTVMKLIEDGRPSPKGPGVGPYAVETAPGNPKVRRTNGAYIGVLAGLGQDRRTAQIREREFSTLVQKFTRYRAKALDMELLTPQDLQQLERLRRDPSSQFPASVLWLSRETKLSPWDIADRQLAAAGKQPLTKPPEIEWSQTQVDPRLSRLLNFSPSFNRTQRAFSGAPWNINKVPKGYGAIIERAAQQNGLDPALLAGLLQTENARWDPNISSRAGAVGLAQIMPDTGRELGITNLRDPVQSINGGARYLRKMLDMFNGDITAALRAYNQGPGNQQRFPAGVSGEAREYPGKVLRAAAAFGYGFGAGSPFRRQELMNPRLAYRIGSLGYGSTGPHLDVKPVSSGTLQSNRSLPAYRKGMLDQFVMVKLNGKLVPLSKGTETTDDDRAHRNRGSFGHDYAAPDGTEVYLRNGARVVGTFKGDQGTDHTIIELPDGRRFQFLHGRNAK